TVVVGLQPDTPHLPLRFIYNNTREGIWELAGPAKSDVRSIADLKGKTVGIGGPAFGNVPVLKAAIAASGLKISDVNLQPVGVGSPAFRAMTSGQIDALNLWDTMHAALERAGFPLRRLEFPEEFVGNPSHGLIATEAKIANEPELIGRFGRAWSKGEVACAANIDGCLIAFWRQYPQLKPANKTLEEAIAYERPLLAAPHEAPLLRAGRGAQARRVHQRAMGRCHQRSRRRRSDQEDRPALRQALYQRLRRRLQRFRLEDGGGRGQSLPLNGAPDPPAPFG